MIVLLIENQFEKQESHVKNAIQRLVEQLLVQGIEIIRSDSLDDATAIIAANTAVDCMLLTRTLYIQRNGDPAQYLLTKLHERQPNVPVFLLSDRGKITTDLAIMQQISEFAWILEDSAKFIAGRIIAAIRRYNQQLLPPLMSALMSYNETHEYSWAAPGHQGGVAFTKTPAGNIYHNFYGENLFRTDMGIERSKLGSLLDHSGAFGAAESNISRIFGSERSYSVVVGTSGSNRSIMQACIGESANVIIDRNCHKSIEQGMILTGAKPTYMVPTRNQYGIIGPVSKDAMKAAIADTSKPVYAVLTNCTYDGLCYNAEEVENELKTPYLHFDEAWYGYARFNPMYCKYYAMRGNPKDSADRQQTIFATHSSHKMLNALSQGSYVHIRNGQHPLDHARFNQAYMMHTTTSPLYAIAVSNDIAAQMMDGDCGRSLIQEIIDEAVDFRQTLARLYKEFSDSKEWFFKPWNIENYTDPVSGVTVAFEDIPAKELTTEQSYWVLKPKDTWHGFEKLDSNWAMLDPIKVSILSPGMNSDGSLAETGVPAALVNAWLARHGIVPTRSTDFQLMFLFSMGVTKGKWGTLLETLLSFKRHYDANTSLTDTLPDMVEIYGDIGLRDLGTMMFNFLKKHNLSKLLNRAYTNLPDQVMLPRKAYQTLIDNIDITGKTKVELVNIAQLSNRITANAVIPYPPGIPMMISGERFGKDESDAISYLSALQEWDNTFPGFEHETEGVQSIDGTYYILCVKETQLI